MSSSKFTSGCGAPPAPSKPSSGPPASVPVTVKDTCDASDVRAICEAVAAGDIAACDPALGYTGELVTYSTINVPGYAPAPYPSVEIACNAPTVAPAITVTETDFRSLPLTPSTISVGPAHGWLPVNMAAAVYTDSQPQTLTTTLLGTPVTVRATPTTYTWNWADDCQPTETTDPSAPWPSHTVSHTFERTGTYTVTMTTTWTGEYSLDAGATYTPITGTATTSTTAPPLTVHELRSHLVDTLIT